MAVSEEPLRIEVPQHPVARAIFVAAGVFVIGIAIYELWRGVWPPNVFSLFFLFMILGACTVGGPTIMGGLFGYAATWEIKPGLITIALRNPFRSRLLQLRPADVLGLKVIEREEMEGDNTWSVQLTTSTQRFETQNYARREAAEDLLHRIRAAFKDDN